MKFFFDNNLSVKLARGLHSFVHPEHEVVHLKEKFPADTADADWINALGKEKDWIIITGDIHIGKNAHEIAA